MTAFWVQVVVFCFSGLNNLIGIYLVVRGDIDGVALAAVFLAAVIFLIIAAVNPYEIIKIAYSRKGGLSIERHISSPEERKEILKIAQDEPVKVDEKEKEKLVEAAKERPDERRSAEDYIVLATEAWRAKKYDYALQLAFVGLNLDPKNKRVKATLLHRIGSVYEGLKALSLAETYYKKAIELDSKFSWPRSGLGNVYADQKKYGEAEKSYKKAIELDPEYAMAYFNLGILYDKQEKYEETEKLYKKAIELDPEDAVVHYNLGNLYDDQKKFGEAETEYKKAIELDPEYAKAINNLKRVQEKIREQKNN